MTDQRGARPSRPTELTRAEDRVSFLYLEHCTIGRDSNAITASDDRGVIHIPSASLGVLLLGPGTRVTHQAMVVLADSGSSVVWVGEHGVRYYAHGRPLARSTRLLERQAVLVSNERSRLDVARAMYALRFPGEDVSRSTMQQLRGREGARVRSVYREWSGLTGVEWRKREYRPDDFDDADLINQALSAAHTCLYGAVHAVIAAVGCSPGLGFVHRGNDRSFVYDIADLYKATVSVPAAFLVVARHEGGEIAATDVPSAVRREVRDRITATRLLSSCTSDIRGLLLGPDSETDAEYSADILELWDPHVGRLASGTNYGIDVADSGDAPW